MTNFSKICGAVLQFEKALPAILEVNSAVDSAECALGNLEFEREALVDSAVSGTSDAAKLVKAVDALRVKRLALLLAMARIPKLKAAAQIAIRQAAADEVELQLQALATHQKQLEEAARLAGYEPGSRQWLLMFSHDGTLAAVKRFATEAKTVSLNYRAATPEDEAALMDVQQQIRLMLT